MKVITDERCTGYSSRGHPERPARVAKTAEKLKQQTELQIEWVTPAQATDEVILRAHSPEHIARLRIPHDFDGDTPYYEGIENYARASVDAALLALKFARAGEVSFSLMRPPGHHATRDQAMGFCFLNNVAIAALEAKATGAKRVAVFDFDVHHGNGTQVVCMDDDRFGFISTHQWGIYPGTGWINDAPHAKGRLVNVPLHEFAGDGTFARVADEIFKPIVESFRPQMLLISAGFDAHWNDPITSLGLSTRGYYEISKKLVALANEHCGGKIVFVLEGGYDPHNVANGAMAVFDALTHSPLRKDAGDPSPYPDSDHESRIHDILKWHGIAQ